MTNKILVAYASRTGSTAGVAQAIGRELVECGAQVDVRPMVEITELSAYQAVVAGSAIQGGKWLPEAMRFVASHRTELAERPFASFLVCMTLAMPAAAKYRQGVEEWMKPVRVLIKPASEGLFAGTLDVQKIPSFRDRVRFKLSVLLGVWSEGDHRDWTAIRTWARTLYPLLLNLDCRDQDKPV